MNLETEDGKKEDKEGEKGVCKGGKKKKNMD
jgi:hypothetical protein